MERSKEIRGNAIAVGVVMVVNLFLSTTASAYEIKRNQEGNPVRWAQDSIHLTIDHAFVRHFGGATTREAVDEAVNAWAGIPGVPSISVKIGHLPPFNEAERSDGIYFLDEWVTEVDQLALTYTTSTAAGLVVGADVIVNGEMTYAHLDSAGAPSEKFDLAAVLTHEFGHVLGLAESAEEEATMHPDIGPGEVFQRTLAADDRQGVQAVYEEEIEQASSCRYQPREGSPMHEAAILLALLALAGMRRQAVKQPLFRREVDDSP